MAMGNGGVSVFGVALLVILFGCPYELGIGSGRGGFGGAMAQMNEEKEGGNGTVPPAGDDETEVDLEKMLEQKEVDIKKLTKLNEEIKEELRLKTEEASNLSSTVNDLSTQTAQLTDLRNQVKARSDEVQQLNTQVRSMKTILQSKSTEVEKLNRTVLDLNNQLQAKTDEAKKVTDQAIQHTNILNADIAALKTANGKLQSELNDLNAKHTKEQEELSDANNTIRTIQGQLQASNAVGTKCEDELRTLRAAYKQIVLTNDQLQKDKDSLSAERSALLTEKVECDKHTKAQKELSDANNTISTIQGQLQASNAKGTKCEDELRTLKAAHQQIVLTNDQLQKDKDSLSAERSTLLTEKVECDKTKNLVTQLQATHDHNLEPTRQLQDDQQARNNADALAQQKAQRRKRSDTIAGVLLGLVFPLLALLGVLLYLYWQRRRRVFSSAAATSILVDQETELVNPDTAGNFVPTESGFQHPDSVHAGNQENDSYALDHVGNVTSSSGKARSSRRSYVGYEQDAI